MKTIPIGQTGIQVARLAFGTMSFGGAADVKESGALYAACRDAGVTFFDCANVYNAGRSEEILGDLIAHERDQVVISSKAYFPMGRGANDQGASRLHLIRSVEASLKRLKTDHIDLFFLHRWDENTALSETLRAIEDLVRAGKIIHPAVSNYSAWQTMKALGIASQSGFSPLVAMQPMYNLLKRQAEVELLPLAAAESIAVFPYSPLAGGLLSGRYGATKRPETGRIVDSAMYASRYGQADYFQAAEAFSEIAANRNLHPVTLAIAWVAAHPAVTAPLLGARSTAQLAPALEAADLEMDAELYAQIAGLTPTPPPATDRSEERSANTYSSALTKG